MNNYCFLNVQTKVIVIILLYPSCLSISKTKSVITYYSPLSITAEINMSFFWKTTSLKTYHTRERITVPEPIVVSVTDIITAC